MSGTRFARSGRFRFFVCLGVMVLMFGVIAIFHSSQEQLDKYREQHLRCEQQQEALNEQLQSVVEEKYKLKKSHETELNEQMESQRNLEQNLKETLEKSQLEDRVRYDKLQQAHKTLLSKHNELISDYNKSKAQHLEERTGMEKKLQTMRTQLEAEKKTEEGEISSWQTKYNAIVQEKDRLEGLLNAANSKNQLQRRVNELEQTVVEYKAHCTFRPGALNGAQLSNGPLRAPDNSHDDGIGEAAAIENPNSQKSFVKEEVVSPGYYHIPIKITNTKQITNASITNTVQSIQASESIPGVGHDDSTLSDNSNKNQSALHNQLPLRQSKELSFSERNNHSLILNSVENFQILPKPIKKLIGDIEPHPQAQPEENNEKVVLPLSAPRKPTSTIASNPNHHLLEANAHLKPAINQTSSSSSSSSLPPLQQPPNQRKLPDNVAPIPANFEELLQQQDPLNPKELDKLVQNGDAADDAAEEEVQKNENDNRNANGNNNRYANVVNDLENKGHKPDGNDDSGAHEVKDQEFLNDQNFNLPAEDGDNFFEGGKNEEPNGDGSAGDIAVKNHNQMLDDNLNNEVAGDQGKELPDGLHLEEVNDEDGDGDEDDYSNPAARNQGAQAIRN